ncbi:MFS transporter [Haloarchaeobius sp. HME9146]|uniref:MFS transporter n=1 Tax=Haloarchaeobius sp. HME9146 TaxID=2978732 RepID=UPI0021C11A4B|nr:MFS transporter [Haloarchaeobius sp. HME9146]MCT9094564.1 MFS transporter [Haloarchaeobius sp. HME9146]
MAESDTPGALTYFRQFFALERDVFVLSVAMFAFSLGFQMTGRYMGEYIVALGGTSVVVGLYGSFGNLIGAVYPYPGGAVSDRIGSRTALTAFGFASAVGFALWLFAEQLAVGPIPAWAWIFAGLVFAQAWKSFGLGATFAIVKQSVPTDQLATGFASTETFRRVAFLVGPLVAAGLVAAYGFDLGFRYVIAVAFGAALVATVAQYVLYESEGDSFGKEFAGVSQIRDDLASLPAPLRPLLVGDTLVRFANGMVYVFAVLVVTRELQTTATIFGVFLAPEALFGVFLAVEMAVALLTMVPVAKLTQRSGLVPVVGLGFLVYSVFPVLLVNAPDGGLDIAGIALSEAVVVGAIWAFSGLRFAGLPAHKALIVGPAEKDAGGRVTGSYYLVRNAITIPSAAVGGWLYSTGGITLAGLDLSGPQLAFTIATVVGLLGTGYFLLRGEEFGPYA